MEALNGGYQVGRDAAKNLNEQIKAIIETSMPIGVRKRHCLLTGGVGEPSPWTVHDMEFQPLSIAEIADKDGTPIWPPSEDAERADQP